MQSRRFGLFILVLLLCACSQSITVTQPPPTPTSHIVTDTIDFGSSPLWREADTTVTLKLKSNAAVTTTVSDSNFTVLSASVATDSVLMMSVRYQPIAIGNQVGIAFVFAKTDTLASVNLMGKCTTFERRVGDSYIYDCTTDSRHFQDTIITVNVKVGSQAFQSTNHSITDSYLNQSLFTESMDLRLGFHDVIFDSLPLYCNIKVATVTDWDTSGNSGIGDSYLEWWKLRSVVGGDSVFSWNSSILMARPFTAYNSYSKWTGPRTGYTCVTADTLNFDYSQDIGFFTRMSLTQGHICYEGRDQINPSFDKSYTTETYRLLGFHLKR